MLLYPAIDVLKTKVDSKYTLAIMAAKRARDLIDGKPQLTIAENSKPISIATAEIADDLISYERREEEVSEEAAEEIEAAAEEAAEA